MAKPKRVNLTKDEIKAAFESSAGGAVPPILSPAELGKIVGVSTSTIYFWVSQGRLDGAIRKRGKRVLLWRDKAVQILFDGPDWNRESERETI